MAFDKQYMVYSVVRKESRCYLWGLGTSKRPHIEPRGLQSQDIYLCPSHSSQEDIDQKTQRTFLSHYVK